MPLALSTGQVLDVVLAAFLVAVGLALVYAFWWLGAMLGQLRRTVRNAERELLPVLTKAGGTIDRVNAQLDKVDEMTSSAVVAVGAVERAVRAVSSVVAAPVQSLAGLAAGLRHGVSSYRTHHDLDEALRTARDAAARRVADLAEELGEAGRPPGPPDASAF